MNHHRRSDDPYAMPNYRAGQTRPHPASPGHNRMPQPGYDAPGPYPEYPTFRPQSPGPPPSSPVPTAPNTKPRQYAQPTYQSLTNDYHASNPHEQQNYEYVSNAQWPMPRPNVPQQQSRTYSPSRAKPRQPLLPRGVDHPDQNAMQPHPVVRVPPPSNRQQPYDRYGNPHVASQWNRDGYDAPMQYSLRTPTHPTHRIISPSSDVSDHSLERSNSGQPEQHQTYSDARDTQELVGEEDAPPAKRKVAPLGPPPSARRGPRAFYQEVGPVRPITEESESVRASSRYTASIQGGHASIKSFASSNVIPFSLSNHDLHDDEVPNMPVAESATSEEVQKSSARDPIGNEVDLDVITPDSPILFRQASMGKKSKPTLTTVKRKSSGGNASQTGLVSNATEDQQAPIPALPLATLKPRSTENSGTSDQSKKHGFSPEMAQEGFDSVAGAQPEASVPIYLNQSSKSKENLSTHTGSSEILTPGVRQRELSATHSVASLKQKVSKELLAASTSPGDQSRLQPRSPLGPVAMPSPAITLSPASGSGPLKSPTAGFSERGGRKRPPKLDIDAVKKAEERGSLTSLSDLILRATKLASNLDRGRTASRLGTDWFTSGDKESDKKLAAKDQSKHNSVSSSQILGIKAPYSRHGSRGTFNSHLHHRTLPSDSDIGDLKRHERKWCGMPVWAFLVLLVILVLIIAAAVLVPIFLIVVPKENHASNDGGVSSAALQRCQKSTTCQNGGTNVVANNGSCRCVCVNGYTGTTCSSKSEEGCTTMTVGSTSDATVGEIIPRLITGAQSNYNIPLDGQTILGLFSSADFSCRSENALVTFKNVHKREVVEVEFNKRDKRSDSNKGVASTNGIVFESGSPSTTTSGLTTSTASASSLSSTTSTANATQPQALIDFAGVAVLYILQVSGDINVAATAQQNLQTYFSTNETSNGQKIDPSNISLGNGYTCNWEGQEVGLVNGTEVGWRR
ncbi:Hypothetical protein R9X50_00379200 [Acrodontium crateriforme]|uniref:EGF-like domain-containing protein n=1 Tax=Acrodontium crateriforme TaxID=150365 RepID=A0AAQ3RC63_9PEZI|nr:Hypothetical protein R9X50_00379200 [Acrodontium crateriforme]